MFKYLLLFLAACTSIPANLARAQQNRQLRIFIMDTGISFQYPKLLEHLENFDPLELDTNGHGTHIASIILKDACPQVKIVVCRSWDKSWDYQKINQEIHRCYKKSFDYKINIYHYSGGGEGRDLVEMTYIERMRKKNIIYVAAAGNEGKSIDYSPFYPASYNYSNIIAIGALDKHGSPASYSNWGEKVVWMPGNDIEGYGLNGLTKMRGTSQAAALYTNGLVKRFCKGLK